MSETTAPSWLNEQFLHYALNGSSTGNGPEFDLLSYEVIPGNIAAGNNFGSVINKANVKYKRRNKDAEIEEQILFIKSPIESGPLLEMVTEGKFVEKEFQFYNEYVPLMEKLVGTLEIIPKHFSSNIKYTIAIEDLAHRGYVMGDKAEQFDFDQCAVIMKAIATFHAASVPLIKHDETLIETLGKPQLFRAESLGSRDIVKPYMIVFASVVETWKGFEKFGDITRNYLDSFWDRAVSTYNRRKNKMNVLNHGDFWTNNLLLKYDSEGKVDKVKLIDFQMVVYASLGIDLQYILWTSTKPSVREHRLEELLSIYLETLNSSLEKFGCEERLTREELEDEMDYTMFYGFYSVYFAYYVQISGMLNPDDEVAVRSAFEHKSFRENAEQALLYFERKGYFNKWK